MAISVLSTGQIHVAGARRDGSPSPDTPEAEIALEDHLRKLADANAFYRAELGRIDHTTLLPNRRRFLDDLQRTLCNGETVDRSFLMVLVTLAEARQFNEILRALGHAYSEDFVRAGATRLQELLGADQPLYHVSVLSFAFMCEWNGAGDPPALIGAIVDAFRQPLICNGLPIDSAVGVGLTPLDPVVNDAAELLRATLAAAQDSRKGSAGWAWYNKSSDDAHLRAFTLLTDMKQAIESKDQMFLHFQPRICMQTRRCLSAEALVRWKHPTLGMVSPMEFIPLAEATALITPLTRHVFELALKQVAEWRNAGIDIKISVNVSPKNMMEDDFAAFLTALCDDHAIAPSALELEFTEGTISANNLTAMQRLRALNALGIEIAIDDFGSGYSNMSYLATLPAQTLKIDQSFVRPLETHPKNAILIRSIIDLGHKLGYRIVAEGVETEAIFTMLQSWGCDEAQGYWMSRPIDGTALHAWLSAWR
jgi:EAL domain-containing protein (putative c-di-GMP-specific phosphodiesterase class I)/GGDEF domain-containing protein